MPKTHPAFAQIDHRPWPVPERRWAWRQVWHDLLFAHWPVPVEVLRPLLPPQLRVEEYDGTGWVGVVPFRMSGVTRRPLPDLPGLSAFPELNVRTYVINGDRPGVWFFSLDATQKLAIWFARRFFHLPYHHAQMTLTEDRQSIRYDSTRSALAVRFSARYRPTSAPFAAAPGTLVHWFTERYCLYARSPKGEISRTEVHHVPWPLQEADVSIVENGLGSPFGLDLNGPPAHAHFARRLDVVVWSPERVKGR